MRLVVVPAAKATKRAPTRPLWCRAQLAFSEQPRRTDSHTGLCTWSNKSIHVSVEELRKQPALPGSSDTHGDDA